MVKVAKRARGLLQNDSEGDWLLVDERLVPKALERGSDYVIMEKAENDRTKVRKFLKPLDDGMANGSW